MTNWEITEKVMAYLKENHRLFNCQNLCIQAGVSPSLLSKMLKGERHMSWKTVKKFAEVFRRMKIDVLS